MADKEIDIGADNPTFKLFDKVFRHHYKPKSLGDVLNIAMPEGREADMWNTYMNTWDKRRVTGGKYKLFSGLGEVEDLITGLGAKLSGPMDAAIRGLAGISGVEFLYDPRSRGLLAGSTTTGRFSPLPIQGIRSDVVSLGGRERAVNLITQLGRTSVESMTWADAYYTALVERIGVGNANINNLNTILEKQILNSSISRIGIQETVRKRSFNSAKPIVFFDLETTSKDLTRAEILQLGWQKYQGGKLVSSGQFDIMPEGAIDLGAQKVHGITREGLVAKGAKPFSAYASQVREVFEGAVLGGFNVKAFDIPILRSNMAKAGMPLDLSKADVVDVMDLYSAYALPGKGNLGKSLDSAFKFYTGQTRVGAHQALTDVEHTVHMFEHMLGRHKNLPTDVAQIAALMRGGGLRGVGDTGPSLGSLLQSGTRVRGRNIRLSARTAGLKQVVAGDHEMFRQISRFREAKTALAMIIKSTGRSRPQLGIFAGLPEKATAVDMLDRALAVMSEFTNTMPRLFEEMGLGQQWNYTKAEYLFDKSNIVLPTRLPALIYGNMPTPGFLTKGSHQVYRMASTTAQQLKGGARMPLYLSEAAYDMGGEFTRMHMPLRVGVADVSKFEERLLFQESGALLTGRNAYRKLGTPLPIGSVTLRRPTDQTVAALEQLFQINLASGQTIHDINKSIPFNARDMRRILTSTPADLNSKEQAVRELLSKSKEHRNVWRSVAYNKGKLSSVDTRDGSLILNFLSAEADIPGTLEMVVGHRRFTAAKAMASHPLKRQLARMGVENGIDLVIPRSEYEKMKKGIFLDNFFDVLEKEGMHEAAASVYSHKAPVRLPGSRHKQLIPIISDERSAYDRAQAKLAEMLGSNDERIRKIASRIKDGEAVVNVHGLDKVGIKSISAFTIQGAIRSDFMMDINNMKSYRITPNKMRNLALKSRLLGYESPYEDPVFYALAKGWKGKGIGINPKTLDFMLEDTHMAREYAQALSGKSISPEERRVIKVTEEGLFLGDKKLKGLPDLEQFSHKAGGVSFDDLKGTILDRKLSKEGVLYLDVGKPQHLRFLNGVQDAGVIRSRYIPISTAYVRANMGVNNRLVVGKNHPAYNFIQALHIAQNNPSAVLRDAAHLTGTSQALKDQFFDLMGKSTKAVLMSMAGKQGRKGGLFERTNTILPSYTVAGRLTAKRAGPITLDSLTDLDDIFSIDIGKHDLEEVLYRRAYLDKKLAGKGGFDPHGMQRVYKELKETGFTYAMLTVDPTQRPEHQQLVKMRVVESIKRDKKYAYPWIQANPIWFHGTERDADRDVARVTLLEGLISPDATFNRARLADQFERQKKQFSMSRWLYLAETGGSKTPNTIAEMFGGFIGQKAFASLGYTIAGPSEMMHGLAMGQDMGIKAPTDLTEKIISPFKGKPQMTAVAETLGQNLFQGGVAKGAGKTGLAKLGRDITEISMRHAASYQKSGMLDYDAAIQEFQGAFRPFLEGLGKNREFMAIRPLLLDKGWTDDSIKLVEQDLIRAFKTNMAQLPERTAKLRGEILDHTSLIMARFFGGAHLLQAAGGMADPSIKGIMRVHNAGSVADATIASKVLSPLAGTATSSVDVISYADEMNRSITAAERAAKAQQKLGKAAAFLSDHKFGAGMAIGAGLGILGHAMFSSATLPPPVDTSQPGDMGPSFQYSNRPKVYDSGLAVSRRAPNPALMQQVQGFNYSSQNFDISMRDRTQPLNPQIAKSYIDRLSEADYVY